MRDTRLWRFGARGMADVFLGLGSNLGDPAANLKEALRRLARHIRFERISSPYLTDPVGLLDQPRFLNAVARGHTLLSPRDVLSFMAGLEDDMGRQREVRYGPRTIDLDLLLYDDVTCEEPDLSLPHPRMAERRFVLMPLAEIAPNVALTANGPTARDLLMRLTTQEAVEKVDVEGWPPDVG